MSRASSGPIIRGQVLPESFGALLREMRQQGDPRLTATLAQARRDGWTHAALAAALGVVREAIRQRTDVNPYTEFPTAELPEIPRPPRRPTPMPRPRHRLLIGAELAERLKAMQAIAVTVTGGTPVDSEKRRVSEELSRILASLVEQGVTVYTIAQALDVEISGVYARLARHGYRKCSPSLADQVYRNEQVGQIQARPECGRGHPMSGDNLYVTPGGSRACRTCQKRRDRETYQRKKAHEAAA